MSPNRRQFLHRVVAAGSAAGTTGFLQHDGPAAERVRQLTSSQAATAPPRKSVAAVVTAYETGLHADVLIGKILEGWRQQGGPGPALKLTSMYVDQFTERDLARKLSKKYNFPVCSTVDEALTLGSGSLAVDGVISIGEHGQYPRNSKGQVLYPRRRFFEQITDTFEKHGQVVPVFSDKHLGPVWEDALWMYQRAQQLKVPFMAGTSMTVGYRVNAEYFPLDSPLESAVGVGYSGLDIYGSHALDFFQWHAERRRGAETGVRWVQCLSGSQAAKAVDDGLVSAKLLQAAIDSVPAADSPKPWRESDQTTLFLLEYLDGFRGAVWMLPETVRGTGIALQFQGKKQIAASRFDERTEPKYPHFAWLLKAIERMIHTGKAVYPVERTLLSSGILDRALTSRSLQGRRLATPELNIRYQPVDYPWAPEPSLMSDPRQ